MITENGSNMHQAGEGFSLTLEDVEAWAAS